MSTNCLVTKLKGSVVNPSLLKLGEIKFRVPSNTNIDTYVRFYGTSPLNVRLISGTGSFSNTGTVTEKQIPISWDEDRASVGVYKFDFYATTECEIAFDRKYQIKSFPNSLTGNMYIESSDLKLLIGNTLMDHKWCNGVDNDLDMSLLPSDTVIMENSGYIRGEGLHGDITHLLGAIGLFYDEFFHVNSLTADISRMPNKSIAIFCSKLPLSWKTTRDNSYKIICSYGTAIDFGNDLDAMLINQADCQAPSITDPNKLYIKANGTKTSASDAAVATLKGKGLTVIINGETL